MAGFYGVIGENETNLGKNISNSIDLLENHLHNSFTGKDFYLEVSYREQNPLKGNRFYENKMYIALFHGDFVDYEEIPWTSIINDIKKNNFIT